VVITEKTLIRDGFGSQPKFRSLIGEWDGEAIGYALFFGFYSSLKGSGIFLEDLFVREAFSRPSAGALDSPFCMEDRLPSLRRERFSRRG
jgi:hypothetical protein